MIRRSHPDARACIVPCLALAIVLGAPPAQAFSLKTHLAVANEALKSLAINGGQGVVTLPTFGEIPTQNDEVAAAVLYNPNFFRAGVLGPDVFPDLVEGQMLTGHPN